MGKMLFLHKESQKCQPLLPPPHIEGVEEVYVLSSGRPEDSREQEGCRALKHRLDYYPSAKHFPVLTQDDPEVIWKGKRALKQLMPEEFADEQ